MSVIYRNADIFSNYATHSQNATAASPYIIDLDDFPSNYQKLEITYGLITTNSTGNKWAPMVNTFIYPNCKNSNYNHLMNSQ